MTQVSSNLTLFYRLFVPVFFGVFLGALVVFAWTHPQAYYGSLRGDYLRVGVTALLAGLLALTYFTLWRLRRVEMGREWVYVTDYFRQARYPWSNVESVRETPLGLLRLVRVRFHAAGTFGSTALFVASASRWRMFKEEQSERLADRLVRAN